MASAGVKRIRLIIDNRELLQNILAVSIVLLSTMLGIVQYQNERMQMKILGLRDHNNQNLINLVDNWSYYQAKSIKSSNLSLISGLAPGNRQQYIESQKRYQQQQAAIKIAALKLEKTMTTVSQQINQVVLQRLRLLYLGVLLQLAIGLSSIALLLRKNSFYLVVIVYSAICLACAVFACSSNITFGILA